MTIFNEFKLTAELEKRGRKVAGFIPITQKANGSWVQLPVLMAIGKEPGPVIIADGCQHGDEYEGTEGIIAAYQALDVEKMKGAFIGVPAVNVEAFSEMRRYTNLDFVPQDLNRIYPGVEKGTLTLSLADYYTKEFVSHADGLITIHGGGNYLYLEPVTLYQNYGDAVSERSKQMAQAFGLEALWQNNVKSPAAGILDEVAHGYGIPAITPEIGGQSTRVTLREENIQRIRDGIINVLRLFKILDEAVITFDHQYHVEIDYIYGKNGGLHKPLKKGGERVKKGEPISLITDVLGNEVEQILAPYDSRVIGFWAYSVIQPRSWAYLLGKELGKEG